MTTATPALGEDPYLHRAQQYPITITTGANEDAPFVARAAEFPFTSGAGDTPEQAASVLLALIADTLEVLAGDGRAAPMPLASFTGVLELRVPRSLHQALQQRAEAEGVGLDQTATHLLTKALAAEPRVRAGRTKTPVAG